MGRGKHLNGKIEGGGEILTREQTLRLLSEMAQSGSVTAAIALERALRLGDESDDDEDDIWAELDASGRLVNRDEKQLGQPLIDGRVDPGEGVRTRLRDQEGRR